mmetsp:Transcript_33513/g.103833  ORF Transcript_33513/g.103833 Transcript_33513/m.103833 type:complete len:188 (-) Transcript_33513:18-581(-)
MHGALLLAALAATAPITTAFGIGTVVEVAAASLAAGFAYNVFADGQQKDALRAARAAEDAAAADRLDERRARAFVEPREWWREDELAPYDGSDYDGPILLAADGKVFNVWRGRQFYSKGGPYAVMAGRDASRMLAKNRLDGDADYAPDDGKPLNLAEQASLALWVASFEGKYDVVGRLAPADEGSGT